MRLSVGDSDQGTRNVLDTSVITTLNFDVDEASPFSIGGTIFGESPYTFDPGSTMGHRFEIFLTGPGGTVLEETFDVFDLPPVYMEIPDPRRGLFIAKWMGTTHFDFNGLLQPGSYELRLEMTGGVNESYGSNAGSGIFFNHDLNFSVIPAPGAAALLAIAPLAPRRRR